MEHAGRKTRELYNTGITLTNARIKRMDWFRVGRDLFKGEGLVSAGFRVGRTGFGWFRAGRTGFGWFRLVPLFSNYRFNLRDKSTEARLKQNVYCPVVSQGSCKN